MKSNLMIFFCLVESSEGSGEVQVCLGRALSVLSAVQCYAARVTQVANNIMQQLNVLYPYNTTQAVLDTKDTHMQVSAQNMS